MEYITNFYKDLFGHPPSQSRISLSIDNATIVEERKMLKLSEAFTMEEVKVVFRMEASKAPEFDGFPLGFYNKIWEMIKYDLKRILPMH